LKIGIIQPSNKYSALQLTEAALSEGAQLVILPEKWVKHIDEVPLNEFQKLARKYTALIIPGAFEDGVSVISPIISPSGNIVGIAKKIHLFEKEKTYLISGDKLIIFTYRGVKLGITICYDLDFPEVIRSLFLKGVEIVLVPSKVDYEGIKYWREYLRVRVLENRVAIVNSNAIELPNFPGLSVALQPVKVGKYVDAKILAELGENEGYVIADIEPLNFLQLRGERLREYKDFQIYDLGTIQ
jgi:predicted amidohydrolase